MKIYQKGSVIIWLVVVLILIICIGIYLLKNKSAKDPSPLNTKNIDQPIPVDNAQNSGELKIIAPTSKDSWKIGQNYDVAWNGGEGKISLFLQDKTRELSSDILKGNIWYRPDLQNTGTYSFNVSDNFKTLKGPFRFYIKDEKGNSTFSEYFSIGQ
jgi:hypothetical protein